MAPDYESLPASAHYLRDVATKKEVQLAVNKNVLLQILKRVVHDIRSIMRPIHQNDLRSQYVSLACGQGLVEAGVVESTGSVGNSYDNDSAEAITGAYKNQLILSSQSRHHSLR